MAGRERVIARAIGSCTAHERLEAVDHQICEPLRPQEFGADARDRRPVAGTADAIGEGGAADEDPTVPEQSTWVEELGRAGVVEPFLDTGILAVD